MNPEEQFGLSVFNNQLSGGNPNSYGLGNEKYKKLFGNKNTNSNAYGLERVAGIQNTEGTQGYISNEQRRTEYFNKQALKDYWINQEKEKILQERKEQKEQGLLSSDEPDIPQELLNKQAEENLLNSGDTDFFEVWQYTKDYERMEEDKQIDFLRRLERFYKNVPDYMNNPDIKNPIYQI